MLVPILLQTLCFWLSRTGSTRADVEGVEETVNSMIHDNKTSFRSRNALVNIEKKEGKT